MKSMNNERRIEGIMCINVEIFYQILLLNLRTNFVTLLIKFKKKSINKDNYWNQNLFLT